MLRGIWAFIPRLYSGASDDVATSKRPASSFTQEQVTSVQENLPGSQSEELEPPRKRQRTELSLQEDDATPIPHENVVRDPTYYIDDGDCVILVGNTLFKVCLTRLHFRTG